MIVILTIVGAVALSIFLIDSLWSVLELISSYLMPYFQPAEVQPLAKKFGPWAVVTGGTDGIGKQYALELARRGINIVIISRNPDKLRNVASEIEKQHSVKTKTVVADFSKGAEIYTHIEAELKDVPIGILDKSQKTYEILFRLIETNFRGWKPCKVTMDFEKAAMKAVREVYPAIEVKVNNVGVQYDYMMPLCDLPPSKSWEIINVNVGAVTSMCRLVLPTMVAQGRGALVNVSSGSELQPLPLMTVYAATKAYVHSFTHAIREEYSSKGIFIQHVAPLFVSTKMNSFSQQLLEGSLFVPDAATYAKYAVSTLGRVQDTTGYWLHGIQYCFVKIAPVWIRTKIGAMMNESFRQEYLRNTHVKSN